MQKRSNLLLLSVLLLSISCLTAQNTGYMGKRVIFNVGAEFSPAWKRPVFENPIKPKWFSFNSILSPSIEIIAHKTGTAGVVYHFLKTKYNTPLKEKEEFREIIYLDSIYEDELPVRENLTAHGFGIFYKQYLFTDGRAPIGAYFRFQFDGFFFKSPSSYDNRTAMMNDKLFAMKIEFGNDFLLFNRLRLSTGLSLGSTFGGYKGLSYENTAFNFDIFPGHQQMNEYARSRIFGAYWIGFTVNIGFLAF